MRTVIKPAVSAVGLALLLAGWMSFQAFAPPPGPPPPLCEVTAKVEAPEQAFVGDEVTLRGQAETMGDCGPLSYFWGLSSAPEGVGSWSTVGREVTYTPQTAGNYVFQLQVIAGQGKDTVQHGLRVTERESPLKSSETQEYALILSLSEQRTFPGTLGVAAGSLRIFLTSLDQAATVVLRREGAQAGVATVLVGAGRLATAEVELTPGTYELLLQGTDTVLGRLEAR